MAKSTTIKLRGTLNWAKVFPENRDMTGYQDAYVDCDGAYTVNLQMDEENYQKLQATGSPKTGKKVGDLYDVKFVRKHVHDKIPDLGGPPGVYDEKGEAWDFDIDGVIPNGSEGTVLVNVYQAGRTYGTRLQKVQVLERGELSQEDNFLEKPANKPKTPVAPKESTKVAEDLDDDIPF